MKLLYKICGISVLFVALMSCQKELSVENGGITNPTSAVLKMKIDGVQWTADNGYGANIIAGFISFGGLSKDHKELAVTLSDTTEGTYTLDLNSIDVAALVDSTTNATDSYTSNGGADSSQSGGTVTVSKIDRANKTLTGTFKFKMFRSADSKVVSITEGSFTNLPYSSSLPPANASDTLHVKIDGTLWNAAFIQVTSLSTEINIIGATLDGSKAVSIQLPANTAPGTYSFSPTSGIFTGVYVPNTSSVLISQTGTIKILENNTGTKRLRGNFDFKGQSLTDMTTAQLTEGYFSVGY